jgi:hypothetical protein
VPISLSVVVNDGNVCLGSEARFEVDRGGERCIAGSVLEGSPSAVLMVNLASDGDLAMESSSVSLGAGSN